MQKHELQTFQALKQARDTPLSMKSDKSGELQQKSQSHPNSTSSCSSASGGDDSVSVSATQNSTTTRRQRSLSAHAKTRSRQADELKQAKSNMVARVQLGLIGMVNNREVTAREKRIQPDERTYLFSHSHQQEGTILKPAFNDLSKRASPDAQQRRSKLTGSEAEKSKSAIFQHHRIGSQEIIKSQQNAQLIKQTRANKVPHTPSTVFSNLSHDQNTRTRQICHENSNEILIQGQLAALSANELEFGQSNRHQRDQSQPQIRRSKTLENIGETEEQQQNLKTNASAFLFDRQVEEPKQAADDLKHKQIEPRAQTAPAAAERQIKYLGLVIEKNEEQDLHEDDYELYCRFRSLREELIAAKSGKRNLEEDLDIQRQYFPVRERYIRIVKKCRRRVIESFEKRGGRDFRRTRNALLSVVDQQHQLYQQDQRLKKSKRSYQ